MRAPRSLLAALLLATVAPAQVTLALHQLQSGGELRTYRVWAPLTLTDPAPVVLAFHGGFGNALQLANGTSLCDAADAHGFLLVLPEGTLAPGLPAGLDLRLWNAGGCCYTAADLDVDDVGFVDDLLDDLEAQWNVDRKRVFATGFSNGAMLAYRLATELADRIAAIAPVSGSLSPEVLLPTRPVPVIAFHGLLDQTVPFAGGAGNGISGFDHLDQPATIAAFAAANGSGPATAQPQVGQALPLASLAAGTGADITYWLLLDHAHSWPGRPSEVFVGAPFNTDVCAEEEMWSFFAAHPRETDVFDLGGACTPDEVLAASEPVLGQTFTVVVSTAQPLSAGLFALSLPPAAPLPLGVCAWHLGTPAPVTPFTSASSGLWEYGVAIPATPVLRGAVLRLQAVVFGTASPLGFSVTNGLEVTLGF